MVPQRVLFTFLLTFFILAPGLVRADPSGMMSVDDIERGMTGVGRTVFHGTRIDTFSATILGVLRNVYGPGSNLILARLSGGPLAQTGVISGMSGSPVYVDGKLIGAVAYAWSFAKEPITGITPIGEMLEVMDRPSSSSGRMGSRQPVRPFDPSVDDGAWAGVFPGGRAVEAGPGAVGVEGLSGMQPVALPLVASGFSPQVLSELRSELEPMGLLPVQGGGGSDASLPPGRFEPGAALGVQLMRGDYSMTAIGTLTYRDGDRVVGFGHPLFLSGSTSLPMTAAFIHDVVPSQMTSFKMGVASQALGTIVQDRAPGISGVLGQSPGMIPMRVGVRGLTGDSDATFRMEVIRSREIGPTLMRAAVTNSLMSATKVGGESTVQMTSRVHLKGHPPLLLENLYAGPVGLGQATLGATEPIRAVVQNRFEAVEIESVDVDMVVEEQTRAARIDVVRLDRSRFEPGDTARVDVVLKPYLGAPRVVSASVTIPQTVPGGRLVLRVSGGAAYRSSERKRAPGEYKARSLDHLIELLNRTERNDTMVLELLSMSPGVTVEGREMGTLPLSVQSALRRSRDSGAVRRVARTVMDLQRIETDYVLAGSATVYLSIGRDGDGIIFDGKGPSVEQKTQSR